MTYYNDVKTQSTETYFNNNIFSIDIFNKKYKLNDNETVIDAIKRVCDYIASVEKTKKLQKYWSECWFDEIYNDFWQPGGSIMQGSNNENKISLMNCTTISMPADSLEGIFKYNIYNVAKCAAYRQGLGVDFSNLRPAGANIHNAAGYSDGPIHWMKLIDSLGYYIGQKTRVPAMLFSLSCSSPNIEEFIKIKSDFTKIQNANISVQITNNFYKAIENNKKWLLKFEIKEIKKGDKIYLNELFDDIRLADNKDKNGYYTIAKFNRKKEIIKKEVDPKYILELIAKGMVNNAEPGIQNIDIAKKYSNSDVVGYPIISTNACCVPDYTKIITNDGVFTIKELYDDIIKNDSIISVLTYNIKNKHYEFKKIINIFQQRTDTTIILNIIKNNEQINFECSSDHPILTKNRGYVRAISITNDDDLLFNNHETGKLVNIDYSNSKKKLYDIQVKDNNNFILESGLIIHNSEQYLDNMGNCCLASLNCIKFYDKENKFNKTLLKKISTSMNRFLDNVVECEIVDKRYATYDQYKSLKALRRVGAGVTNIGGLLFKNNLEYGSDDGNNLIENFIKYFNYYNYISSINLGKEKGSFEAFNKNDYLKSNFIKHMVKEFPDLKFDTMRNVCTTTLPPVGTGSTQFSKMVLSYGVEPSFSNLYYWKRTRISGKYEYYFIVSNIVQEKFKEVNLDLKMNSETIKDTWDGKYGKPIAEFIDNNIEKTDIKLKNATHVNIYNKLDLMSKIQKNIDSSISVTYMLPEKSNWKDVYKFILKAHKLELKSIAAFPDKQMYGIVSFIPFKELAIKLLNENITIHPQNFTEDELKELNISKKKINVIDSAPKRPNILPADIYNITVKGDKFIIAIGLLDNYPYEMFGGISNGNGLSFKFKEKKGFIEKIKSNQYKLLIGEDIEIEDFGKIFKPMEQILFRLVSTSLRHGVHLKFIIEQLHKASTDMFGVAAAAERILKKYLISGETVGKKCPNCGSNELVYISGCPTCVQCRWSKCS